MARCAVLLAAKRAVANGIVGYFARADHGPGKNLQLPVWVLNTLCLLMTQYQDVRLFYGEYQDYNAGMLRMPGLVVVDVIGYRLCRGHEGVYESVAIQDGTKTGDGGQTVLFS